ncbi:MAG: AMP-binding protein, partial [Oscillospiraceae bacterium]
VANMLIDKGIKKGDAVMVILKRHYQFWFTILALHKIGAIIIPATNLLTKKDIVYRTNFANIKAVVCSGTCHISDYVDQSEEECGNYNVKIIVNAQKDGWIDFNTEIEKYPTDFARVENSKDDSMLGYFTSGTTGNPKLVLHSYSYPLAHIITAVHWQCCKEDGLHLTLAETGWGKAVWGKLYGQWLMGAGIFVYDFDKFNPSDLLKLIEKHKITTFCAPPPVFRFFIKEGVNAQSFSSVTHTTIAGEPLNEEVFNRFKEITGLPLTEGFGQTETTLLIATLKGMKPRPGSMGKASPLFDVDIVDENCKPVPIGTIGEIIVRPNGENYGLLKCYYNDEERTQNVWKNKIFHTGDTAYKDENGYFWYIGRVDDIIKSSGYRIGPFEVESVLMEHPAVLECAVTGSPDPVRGQVVKATIVLTSKFTPSEELSKEIQAFVKKNTAPYKYPRIIEFVDELPKTISGKIKRKSIRNIEK